LDGLKILIIKRNGLIKSVPALQIRKGGKQAIWIFFVPAIAFLNKEIEFQNEKTGKKLRMMVEIVNFDARITGLHGMILGGNKIYER